MKTRKEANNITLLPPSLVASLSSRRLNDIPFATPVVLSEKITLFNENEYYDKKNNNKNVPKNRCFPKKNTTHVPNPLVGLAKELAAVNVEIESAAVLHENTPECSETLLCLQDARHRRELIMNRLLHCLDT